MIDSLKAEGSILSESAFLHLSKAGTGTPVHGHVGTVKRWGTLPHLPLFAAYNMESHCDNTLDCAR